MLTDKAIIICAILIFSIVTVSNFDKASSQNRGGLSLYNNTDYGFQLLYPKDWAVIEGDSHPGDYITDIVIFEPLGEKGKHFSKKFICGEVCLAVWIDNSPDVNGLNLQQYFDATYNKESKIKGFKLLEHDSASTLGNKNAFEILSEQKQGNRQYLYKIIGTSHDKDFLRLDFKSRTKLSEQALPVAETMIDSFRFTNTTSK